MATAIILCSVYIGLNNFFSGLIVRPQFLVASGFYSIPYYICPGRYVYDGLLMALFQDNDEQVRADPGSLFEKYLIEKGVCAVGQVDCTGTAFEFVQEAFGGELGVRGPGRSGIVLGCILLLARILTWIALKNIRFS